jgi:hypothetical protein
MSSLLEQAIIDATALKEAAVKNAEAAIIDKYSTDIREAVESLLEQEEEETIADEEIALSDEELDLPLAGAPVESSDDDVMVLDMEELSKLTQVLTQEEPELVGEPVSHETLADVVPETPPSEPTTEMPTVPVELTLEDISVEQLGQVLEELIVDINPVKDGWAGTPEPIMDDKGKQEVAHLQDTQNREEFEALRTAVDALTEERTALEEKNRKITEAFYAIKENFDAVNLSNARLIYVNRILTNDSLNERQKEKIVEAVSKAETISEAKVIFETLQSAVGSVTGKARPKSLRETIERPSATLPRRAPAKATSSHLTDRMQILAGIKKN